MLRNLGAALATTWSTVKTHYIPDDSVAIAITKAMDPNFQITVTKQPYIHAGPCRLYKYRITEATSFEFRNQYRGDLMGNHLTEEALNRALGRLFGFHTGFTITEETVVLHAGHWAGEFDVAANRGNGDVLILRLSESADKRVMS